jgi:hypothetical protein
VPQNYDEIVLDQHVVLCYLMQWVENIDKYNIIADPEFCARAFLEMHRDATKHNRPYCTVWRDVASLLDHHLNNHKTWHSRVQPETSEGKERQ